MARGNDVQLGGITDLNLLADIKRGFVDALEVVTYVDRLRKVLKTLNGLRLGSRESSSPASPYTDIVARWRIVHSFRWSIVDGKDGAPDRLLLSVNFDGGWEPYMRVIWDQLGSTLDLMLCHTEGYTLSRHCSFETYARWVREHEISADFLFIESGRSVGDGEYLARLEAAQRGRANELAFNRVRAPASGETPPLPTGDKERFAMAARGLLPLAGLYTLQRFFGAEASDRDCLLRATHDVLFELRQLNTAEQFPQDGGKTAGGQLRLRHHEMLAWFEQLLPEPEVQARKLSLKPGDLQCCLLTKPPGNRGGLVLLRVAQPTQAVAWLSTAPVQRDNEDGAQLAVWRQVALTLAGLKALGLPASRLDRFPQAFKEGMAARAGLLGDVRHNHPTHWVLAQHVNKVDRIDPANAHVLVQLRFAAAEPGEHFSAADDQRLHELAEALTVNTGLALMAIEPMRSNAADKEHFGFKDGISQPVLGGEATGQSWDDRVKTGEILQGFPTERDKGHAVPELPDALLDRGSFLVVRKLRQYTGRFAKRTYEQAKKIGLDHELVLAKLMGRWQDGRPLAAPGTVGNDFNFAKDKEGSACPFHSHIRRTNPRDLAGTAFSKNRMPRILRRGMSYGAPVHPDAPDDEDRGLVFMAYNAHLAEQFEVVQRWVAGGNASGGYSAQSDPLLGVVDGSGGPRLFPFEVDGKPHEIDLGPDPFVTLQWGAYFFVPSIAALKALPGLVELPLPLPAPTPLPERIPDLRNMAAVQLWLEDTTSRDAAWAWVRAQPGGVVDTAYGVLVGAAERVCEVLRNAPDRYSVSGYGERMHDSIGVGYLGLDDDTGHREQAPVINAAIEAYREEDCYALACRVAKGGLQQLKDEAHALLNAFPASQKPKDLPTDTPLDFERLSEGVLAKLCQLWFGQPDGRHIWGTEFHAEAPAQGVAARCPRDLFKVSRHVFGPYPTEAVKAEGRAAGRRFTAAVEAWLAEPGTVLPPLAAKIVDAAKALPDSTPDLTARTLAGIMLGFPPTTHANLLTALVAWTQTRKLWELQTLWHEVAPDPQTQMRPYAEAVARLRPTLVATLTQRPTPFQVWRKAKVAHKLGPVDVEPGRVVVIGLGSATQQDPLRHHVAFGGDCNDPQGRPPHACSGYGMGMGVMLGVIAAVLDAGVLRYTGAQTMVAMGVD
ncbi:Dyp-type peroxidase family [Pelomonas saccharophila]|uniref:Dyp-type peroxidase family n=1 Tax=Roseateles saccharophilus TaxID=304 RepID=A0ABU1YPD5_ROSSA|nr:Dyp-type peroxidase domain-containing protein [Roseateles saccharophilus]MDR7270598.1 Dyp-type peroxidase family [Roseateles saccharophilus]